MSQLPVPGLGRRVAEARKRNGWSAQRLADNTGGAVSRPTIANLESGRRTDIGLRQFLALCLALRVPPTALLIDLDRPFSSSGIEFPGPAPAPLEPVAPQVAVASWLNGQLRDGTTPAGRHAQHITDLLEEYLAATDEIEITITRERLNPLDRSRVEPLTSTARRDEIAAALRDAGVELPTGG